MTSKNETYRIDEANENKQVDKSFKKILLFSIIDILITVTWLITLIGCDCYFLPYFIVFVLSAACVIFSLYQQRKSNNFILSFKKQKHKAAIIIFAIIFTLCVTLANHNLWNNASFDVVKFIFMLLGGFVAAFNLNIFAADHFDTLSIKMQKYSKGSLLFFLIPFVFICLVNVILLFCIKYPGSLSPDSISQVSQALNNNINNHAPFMHTLIIQFFIKLFPDNLNAGVAAYNVFQIIFMAACFAFCIYTMKQAKAPLWVLIITLVFFAFAPYHMSYSITMWKDVFFGGFVLLFCVCLYRALELSEQKILNYILFCVSGVGLIAFRSNAIFAFIVFVIVAIIFLIKKQKSIALMLIGILLVGFFIRYPLMSLLNVAQPNLGESLSIPSQQVAYTYKTYNDFTPEQEEMLSKIIDLNVLKNNYQQGNADNIKNKIRDTNPTYLNEHLLDYAKLYIDIGLNHPDTYFFAWVDQTRGYYNSGYAYWYFYDKIYQNDFGIERSIANSSETAQNPGYFYSFHPWLCIFVSIGLCSWIFMYLLFVAWTQKKKSAFLCILLNILIIATLLISTPIFTEFRYAYNLFCCLPFVYCITMLSTNKYRDKEIQLLNKKNTKANQIKVCSNTKRKSLHGS